MRHERSVKLVDPTAPPAHAPAAAGVVIEIFTDGACKGNPGPGGWGAWLKSGVHEKELFGGERATTNNRMELTAVIRALQSLKRRSRVVLHTDSQYVKLGVTEWLPMWIRRGWKTAGNKAVKNSDLWRELAHLAAQHDIDWRWVRGHAGVPGNERADRLANRGVEAALDGIADA
ncbi:MAG: ribonuclease HI [Gemmatimonadota bacterium]